MQADHVTNTRNGKTREGSNGNQFWTSGSEVSKQKIVKSYCEANFPVSLFFHMAKYEHVCDLLNEEGFDKDVLEVFRKNRIDVLVFVEFDKEDFEQLGIVALGDKRLMKLQKRIDANVSEVFLFWI